MMNTEQTRPGADEHYIMATNASDLTVDSNKVTAVDFLIEAGLVANRMGAILIHLAGEWAAADKPPKLGDADIVALAELLPRLNAKGKLDMKKARAIALNNRNRLMRRAYDTLPSLGDAMAILHEWAARRNVDPDILRTSLYSYLAPACPVCDGRGAMKLPDAPGLGKQCHACNGHREPGQTDGPTILPRTQATDRVVSWLKSCAGKHKAQRQNVRHDLTAIVPMSDRLRGPVEAEQKPEVNAAVAAVARASMNRGRART
jgi:hypothetical protein